MEDRRIYRGIEEAALTGRWEDGDHRHSWLSRALRYRYRELVDAREFAKCRLLSVSALYGNSRANIDSGNEFAKDALQGVMATVPYLVPPEAVAAAKADRMGALYDRMLIEYNRMKAGSGSSGG